MRAAALDPRPGTGSRSSCSRDRRRTRPRSARTRGSPRARSGSRSRSGTGRGCRPQPCSSSRSRPSRAPRRRRRRDRAARDCRRCCSPPRRRRSPPRSLSWAGPWPSSFVHDHPTKVQFVVDPCGPNNQTSRTRRHECMADATTIRRYGAIAWLLLACVLALLMAGLAYWVLSPVRWDAPGKFGALALFFPLHLLVFTFVAAVLTFLARRSGAGHAAWVFILVTIVTVAMARVAAGARAGCAAARTGGPAGQQSFPPEARLMRCRALVTLTAAAIVFAVAPAFAQVKGTATYWKLTYLGDQPIPVVRWAHEPHVILHPDTRRASGAGGCNRFTGSYEVNGDRLAFGETAATMMACLEGMETEKEFFAADSRLVTVEGGIVGGAAAGGVISWKGIPYAAPPVGNLRWRLPQPVLPWTGVKETSRFGPACMQTDNVPKSEDCLTLNVWRPAQAAARALPVMVWMHGGAMVHGGAPVYRFDAMAAKGVMIVSMNFRLGRFGYFAHPALGAESPDDVRGNYGYMDQLAALQWVHSNIAAFGGDPDQVTIFGESAGGGSVLAHLVSPMSRGLFQRAILQSPGTPGPRARAIPSSDLATAEKIATDWSRSVGVTGEGV